MEKSIPNPQTSELTVALYNLSIRAQIFYNWNDQYCLHTSRMAYPGPTNFTYVSKVLYDYNLETQYIWCKLSAKHINVIYAIIRICITPSLVASPISVTDSTYLRHFCLYFLHKKLINWIKKYKPVRNIIKFLKIFINI